MSMTRQEVARADLRVLLRRRAYYVERVGAEVYARRVAEAKRALR